MNPKKRLHVTGLLLILLPIKSLTVNDVTDVTPFPDLSSILQKPAMTNGWLAQLLVIWILVLPVLSFETPKNWTRNDSNWGTAAPHQ